MDESLTTPPHDYIVLPKDAFEVVHREIHYEHSLISSRMTWYVTSQSFLMTAFAVAGSQGHRFAWLAQWFIPVLGLATSTIIAPSVWAAIGAMQQLRGESTKLLNETGLNRIPFGRIHEQNKWFHSLGMLPAKIIPALFAVSWIVALTMALR
jgi:hypothetical protein